MDYNSHYTNRDTEALRDHGDLSKATLFKRTDLRFSGWKTIFLH